MRKVAMVVVTVVAVVGTLGWAMKCGPAKGGKDVVMSGTISCAACKLAGSPQHKCSKACCQGCIKGGDSALFEGEKGNLYLLISREKEKPVLTSEQMELFGDKVTVKGILVEKGGLKGIYVESIDKGTKKALAKK